MNLLFVISLILPFILLLGFFNAYGRCIETETTPPISCGPHCVIETAVCDTKEQAQELANKYHAKLYEFKSSDKFFVDIPMTEQQSNLL